MRAKIRPGTMSYAVVVTPLDWSDWDWYVVQRNAPGAISAIAFTVSPVRLSVRFISGAGVLAISSPSSTASAIRAPSRERPHVAMVEAEPRRAHRADRDVGVRMGCAAVAFGGDRGECTRAATEPRAEERQGVGRARRRHGAANRGRMEACPKRPASPPSLYPAPLLRQPGGVPRSPRRPTRRELSLIHISEPTR